MGTDMSNPATQAAKAAAGDEEATNALLQASRHIVLTYAVSLLGNQHEAEDVVQDSLLIAWSKLGELKAPEAFSSWLREIVRRQCLQRIGRRRPYSFLWSDGDSAIADSSREPSRAILPNGRDPARSERCQQVARGVTDDYGALPFPASDPEADRCVSQHSSEPGEELPTEITPTYSKENQRHDAIQSHRDKRPQTTLV